MIYFTIVVLIFSVLAALDRIFGGKLGLGKEYERAFNLLGAMSLSMIGMIVISPVIADMLKPISEFLSNTLHIDASIIPASLFANDMGGAPLSVEMASNKEIGLFNALVVSSMMGCTMSFTIPFALGVVGREQHKELIFGLLCGIVTIPIGCIVSGIMCKIPLFSLIIILLPLIIFAGIIVLGLIFFPDISVKIFKVFGTFITSLITVGLSLGIINFLLKDNFIEGLTTLEEGALICVNAAVVLSGSFPIVFILAKFLSRPFSVIGKKIGVNEISVVGILSSMASSATSFGMMDRMDKKGVMMNAAFSVSGAFIFGSHLAFTMAFDQRYIAPVIVGKLVSGILAAVLACVIFNKLNKQ